MSKKCLTKYCKRSPRKGRKKCTTCDKKEWRKNNPLKAAFQTLRHNATRRGKVFDLTLEQFQLFCYETNYLAGVGRKKKSYSIDRIDNNKGYTIDNIQILSLSDNSKKRNKTLVYDYRTQYAAVV